MANFQYNALDRAGNRRKGSISAPDIAGARAILRRQGLTPVDLKPETLLNKDFSFDFAPKKKDISMLFKQIASLLRAGVSITETLDLIVNTIPKNSKLLLKAVQGTRQDVQKGETLANAMRKYPRCFDNMTVNMVEAGESSGSLDDSFESIAEQIDKSDAISSAIKKALIYPIIVLIVAVIVIIVLLVLVVPSFMKMFEDIDVKMPAITIAVVKLSDFVKNNIILIILGVIALVVLFRVFKKSAFGSDLLARMAIKLPGIGPFVVKSQCSKFARTLGVMQQAGLTLTNSLDITAGVVTNLKFKQATVKTKDLVMTGVPLAEAMEQQGIFPIMITKMVGIGESTGDLTTMLVKTADYYDKQTQDATDALMSIMSPATIILLLVVVGPILAAVLAPMLALYTGLDEGL